MRLNRPAKPRSEAVKQLVHAICSWEQVKTKPEQLFWEQQATQGVQAALASGKDSTLFACMDALWEDDPDAYERMADLVEKGVNLAKLDQARRELMRKEPVLIPYKGKLLERVEFDSTGRIASVVIPWAEIERYSPLYNPSMLVIDDMRLVVGVDIAIAYKVYADGKITAKIRCNFGKAIGSDLASAFGGGGHPYASGFKIINGYSIVIFCQIIIIF